MFLDIGFSHTVNTDRILMILDYNSLPVQDFVKRKRGQDKVIKATKGHKTRTALIMDEGFVMLISLSPKTLCKRLWEYSSRELVK